ncbi:fluoride efflux transporter CrcB [Aeromicrobium sp. CFBP 8757]|uniref:fluoride efflux transporter CrcB n=1 Tax=Aeromicrobium sp. CFBP 8757 TaxID=2775288 RepID=UPI00177C0824|nr:fluoride efflux transporter CrcB [Aeromicrobium sp. CFBP 8757]MBD8607928.1 fluoride efflux transporter CrcB [Aeromicrobium sp. CFBP 8757]
MTVLVVALGAAVGAPTRYLVDLFVESRHSSSLPWGTITVNAIGSFVIGFIAGLAATSDLDQAVVALISTGFCGALTTFSTFSFETVRLIEQQHLTAAVLNLGLSLVLTIVLCLGGYELAAAYLITAP